MPMCKVSIDIDEALLRDVMPELDSPAAIRLWVQQLVDYHTQMLLDNNQETVDMKFSRDVTPEELYTMIEKDVRAVYADESI